MALMFQGHQVFKGHGRAVLADEFHDILFVAFHGLIPLFFTMCVQIALQDNGRRRPVHQVAPLRAALPALYQRALRGDRGHPLVPEEHGQPGLRQLLRKGAGFLRLRAFAAVHVQRKAAEYRARLIRLRVCRHGLGVRPPSDAHNQADRLRRQAQLVADGHAYALFADIQRQNTLHLYTTFKQNCGQTAAQ